MTALESTAPKRGRPLARALLRGQSDERLVGLVREGREPAFAEIVRRYRAPLVAFATAYAPPDRAEDVVQESLLRAWDAIRTSGAAIRLRPWLYTIVRNRALNARRDARFHEQIPDDFDGAPQPPEVVLTREELSAAMAAVQALPEAQRAALVQSSLEGRSHEQIAAALGTSPGSARGLIYRARATVRDGVGLIVPLPLIRVAVERGPGEAEAAAAGGALVAGSVGSAGGGTVGVKSTALAMVAVAAAGGGVAVERAVDRDDRRPRVEIATPTGGPEANGERAAGLGAAATVVGSDLTGGEGSGRGGGGGDASGNSGPSASSGPGSGGGDDVEPDDSRGSGSGDGDDVEPDDSSGPGSGEPLSSDDSGPGSLSSGSGSSGDDSSGSGSSDSEWSGSSGSGS